MPDPRWLIYLLAAAACTTFFSMFNAPGIRGWRNVGLLATYLMGIVMFFRISLLRAAGTWAVAVHSMRGKLALCDLMRSIMKAGENEDSQPFERARKSVQQRSDCTIIEREW